MTPVLPSLCFALLARRRLVDQLEEQQGHEEESSKCLGILDTFTWALACTKHALCRFSTAYSDSNTCIAHLQEGSRHSLWLELSCTDAAAGVKIYYTHHAVAALPSAVDQR